MTSSDDMRPEATLLIGLSQSEVQRQTRFVFEVMRQVLCCHSIGWSPMKSITQAKQL